MGRVCVIGSSNLDFTVAVPRLPREGETVSGGELGVSAGGKGANQAVAARRVGAEVRFITLLGADPMGDRLHATLVANGLSPDGLLRSDEAATGVAIIAVDPAGRNQIAVAPGANHRLVPELVRPHADALAWADVLLLQLETPLETVRWALRESRRLGKVAILNPAPARVLPLPGDVLRLVDYLTPNETEAGLLTDRRPEGPEAAMTAGLALVKSGVGAAVLTVGARGAVLVTAETRIHVPAFGISPIDTVGAGDAFNGALAAVLATGAGIADALVVANAAAGLACTRRGAIDALPTRAEIAALMTREGRWPSAAW